MRFLTLLMAAALAALPWSGAQAEPQVLALLATTDAKPLNCTGGECFAEFSSFCMEPDRASPQHLTSYELIRGSDDVELVAETAAGDRSVLSAAEHLRFESVRGFAAVRVSLDEDSLKAVGATRAWVKVGPRVALLPTPAPKYRKPHEPGEIADAAGPHRIRGEKIVDKGGAERRIADLAIKLINAIPEQGKLSEAERLGLWDTVLNDADKDKAGMWATMRTRLGYGQCLDSVAEYATDTLRFCLGRFHDTQVWTLNRKYWASLPGS